MPSREGRRRAVFDMESTGLDFKQGKVHCISVADMDNSDRWHFDSTRIVDAVKLLNSFRFIIGHNICGFDIPYLKHICGLELTAIPRDTLVMSKLFNPERKAHSLEYFGEYFGRKKPHQEQWHTYDPNMKIRCDEDVEINILLYEHFIKTQLSKWKGWIGAIELEQEFQMWQVEQEIHGVDIDREKAMALVYKIDAETKVIDVQLRDRLPKRVINLKPVNKPFLASGDYSKMTKDWFQLEE